VLPQSITSRRIVLVDRNRSFERRVAGALRRAFPDVDVHSIQDPDEALRVLAEEASRLLIVDVQAASLDTVALATSALRARPGLPVIAMSAPPIDTWRRRARGLGAAAWLEKPLRLERLIGLVERILLVPAGFSGELTVESLPELVQMLCVASTSGALRIDHGAECGSIWFDRGAIVHAEMDGDSGASCFAKMLRWTGGVFALDRGARPARRSIDVPVMHLLLEGVRLMDEERASVAESRRSELRLVHCEEPGGDEPSNLVSLDRWTTAAERAAESFERGMKLAQDKRYEEAQREWQRAVELDPDNRTYQFNLRRLVELAQRLRERDA